MKLLTIAVPSYNSESYLSTCLDSLVKGGERVEILVIDDGSTDRTGEIADAYEAKYPTIVRAVHQSNGGHGAGINRGVALARGKYFKSVDSDDTLSGDFPAFLDALEFCEARGGVDLFLTNYRYVHTDGKGDRTIRFANAFPQKTIFGWNQVRRFRVDQILMIHTCTFRTELLRRTGITLPEHAFYEDNYYVYGNLQNVEKLYYMDCDLYRYTIGREGQSVQDGVLARRYSHQILATELCFRSVSLDSVTEPAKKNYMKHEMFIMFCICMLAARLNGSVQAEQDLLDMWACCRAVDPKWAAHFRRNVAIRMMSIPGPHGANTVRRIYRAAHLVVRFN